MPEMINPYIAGGPVTERTMFFGRQDVFEWVQRSLAGKFVDHILVIHGQRRVGKTSVLKQIPFHLPPTYIPVFFDLQGRTRTSIDRFLWRLAKEITRTLRTTQNISLPEPVRKDFSRDPELFQNRFLPQLGQGIGDRRLLLLFDEFDSLEEPTAREMLAQDLIPYFSRLMHAPGPLAFIFSIGSSGRKLEHMQASYTDFFRIALYRKISFLEKEEAFRLITQPVSGVIEYEPQVVEDIFQITSGHPYFTQLVCHELFGYCQKTGKRRITPKDIEAVLGDVVERGMVNLKFVWDDASDPERYVLTALSLAEDGRDAQSIYQFLESEKVRISEREVTDSLRHLQQKDVLTSDNSFTVDLMRLWLLDNKPLDRVVEELMAVSPIAARYIEIAQEFHQTGMRDKALESYRSALEIDPQNLVAQVGIASLIFEQGDLPQAVQEYQKALEIDPEDIAGRSGFCQTHLALGDQLRDEGQVEEALEHYHQVLLVNEQHLEARERLAAHHAHQGTQLREQERFDEAIEAFEGALEFTPDDQAITAQLAETQAARRAKGLTTLREIGEEHFRAERWEQAVASFWEYLSLEPEDEEAVRAVEARLVEARGQRELAEIYRQARGALNEKRYGEAVGLLKEIINRDASYKDATRLLARAVELQREYRPLWKDIRVLGGAGGILFVIIAVFLFRLMPIIPPAPPPATVTPTPRGKPTEAVPPPPPGEVQITFTADRTNLLPGECTTLRWSVQGGGGVELNVQPVERSGQMEVCLEETTPYWIAVDAGDRIESREVVIVVEPGPPPGGPEVISFGADPDAIPQGGCAMLHWEVLPPGEWRVLLSGQEVPHVGDREVCPQATTTYELLVEAPGGAQERQVTLHVEGPPLLTIAQARELEQGVRVMVRGQVTAPPGVFGPQVMYLQDGEAGILSYVTDGDYPPMGEGDWVQVLGETADFLGERELVVARGPDVQVVEEGQPLAPFHISTGEVGEGAEGLLAHIDGVVVGWERDAFALDDGSGQARVCFGAVTELQRSGMEEGDFCEVVGIVKPYAGEAAFEGGYCLWPRYEGDWWR